MCMSYRLILYVVNFILELLKKVDYNITLKSYVYKRRPFHIKLLYNKI